MPKIISTIACNLDQNILQAALPLLEKGKVGAIEWSFDALFGMAEIPDWFDAFLHEFDQKNRLIGHGVFFSLFSGKWRPEQEKWIKELENWAKHYHFDHVSEHFGFMTGPDFHAGAPISLPFNKSTLAIGQDRLRRMQAACQCPVGLENLAFSYSMEEVARHGDFLEKLVAPVNGFIILDLHNLFCQLQNFEVDFEEIMPLYPLERVREIHISGGSWDEVWLEKKKKTVRRDTHDDAVPEQVFDLLEKAIPHCKNLKFVVMEQLGTGLADEPSREQFRQDFLKMDDLVFQKNQGRKGGGRAQFLPKIQSPLGEAFDDLRLWEEQLTLSEILETSSDLADALARLDNSSLKKSDWSIENWRPEMVETARRIAQKWKK